MPNSEAKQFFDQYIGMETNDFIMLPQSGSSRKNYIGNANGNKFIITENSNLLENDAFFYFSQVFHDLKLNTPEIFSISDDKKIYVQSYLGSNTLSEIIQKEGSSNRVKKLVQKSLEKLYTLQTETKNKVDYSKTFEYQRYDEIPIIHDLFYFKFMFADILETHYQKTNLINEFKKLIEVIENFKEQGLMIRDFQSRNIMVNDDDEVFFIDYQSAMYGPLMYDVISFLYQAKANFSDDFREEMLNYYFNLWNNENIKDNLKNQIAPLQLIRFLQVLGVYGFRGLVQKKEHFINSIPQGIKNLHQLSISWDGMEQFPELKNIIKQLNQKEALDKVAFLKNI